MNRLPLAATLLLSGVLSGILGAFAQDHAIDQAFVGQWRIRQAEPAPWAGLQRREPDLLLHGIVIHPDRIVAPPPLACETARVEAIDVPPQGLFQGGLVPETAPERAQALGFSGARIRTLRVTCPNGAFDYHLAGATLKFALDDTVFTMDRARDVEPPIRDETFIARARPSFPCHRARRPVEQLVCNHGEAGAADGLMAAAYARTLAALPPPAAAQLRDAQRVFLSVMERSCIPGGRLPQEAAARESASRCLALNMSGRLRELDRVEVIDATVFEIVPRFAYRMSSAMAQQPDDQPALAIESDMTPTAAGPNTAAVDAFNGFVRRRLQTDQTLMRAVYGRPMPDFRGQVSRFYEVTYGDERLISITSTVEVETGTAVPLSFKVLNWNVQRRRPVTVQDVFVGEGWKEAFRHAAERYLTDPQARQGFVEAVPTMEGWAFGPDGITVRSMWDAPGYTNSDCVSCGFFIPAEDLRSHLRRDSPWRPRTP